MNRVLIDVAEVEEAPWLGACEAFCLRAMDECACENWDLSLLFCDDAFIRSLNSQYRGKDEATDVLSFGLGEFEPVGLSESGPDKDMPEGKGRSRYLAGDIVISLDSLKSNAEYFKVSRGEELKRLIVHGILHLKGMDHEDNDPARPMLAYQEELLSKLSKEEIF